MAALAKAEQTVAAKARRSITKERLIAALADQHGLSKRASQQLFDDLIGMIKTHLQQGERVKLAGFGVLQVRDRPARMGRNPRTGEIVEIKAGKKVAFRAAKKLKAAI
jgi:DNA-binding protein HU-beta